MVVRPVQIHEPFPDVGENIERGRRAIDELAIRARAGERAFKDELMFLARFEAILLQERFDRCPKLRHVENCFNGTRITAAANERTVGALAQHQVERPDDDRLARTGFPRDGIVARR